VYLLGEKKESLVKTTLYFKTVCIRKMSKSYVGAVAKILHRIDCGWESLQFSSRTDGAYGLRTVEY